jgi:epoxyqueuosine reductase
VSADLTRHAVAAAYGMGFSLVGTTALGPADTARFYDAWLDAGHAGAMRYMHHYKKQRRDPRALLPGARTAIVVAMPYGGGASGPVARYARGADYHEVMRERLDALQATLAERAGRAVQAKSVVDSTPLLERDLARRAGLGWFGKNTLLINPHEGSFILLGALLVDLDLASDAPFASDRCGRCTRCLDACPTQAFVAPRTLDARRCIAYLTIELRGPIPSELRPAIGDLLFGCDICQDVCPWNMRFAADRPDPALADTLDALDPVEILGLNEATFAERFARSPVARATRAGLARNAAVALGNSGSAGAVPALIAALADDAPLVRGHAAWALGRLGGSAALDALRERATAEGDPWVLQEIDAAVGS